jgi:hypothetical protein
MQGFLQAYLWVNHKRPAPRLADDDGVLNADSVRRQPSNGPGTDLQGCTQPHMRSNSLHTLNHQVPG